MDLNGHEAGNGGYSQGKSKVHRVSSTRRVTRRSTPDLRSTIRRRCVVLANSDLIDKLGVVLFPSIPLRAPIVRFLDRTFRLLSEPGGASTRDPRPSPSTRRSATLRQATQTDPGGSVLVGLAERSLERLAIQRLYHQSLDRDRLAPERLSPVLGLEGPPR